MKNLLLHAVLLVLTLSSIAQTVTDINGNDYNTLTIGTQEWMAENLKATKYSNGEPIANVTDSAEWVGLTTGAYCWYDNDSASYAETYGALYNIYTTFAGNLCPTGWHVPTDEEWTILTDFLGGLDVAGGILKDTSTTHWHSPNTGATNEVGFAALPGGARTNETFDDIEQYGYFWSVMITDYDLAWMRRLGFMETAATRNHFPKTWGASIRCLKNNIASKNQPDNSLDLNFYPNPATDKLYLNNITHLYTLINIFDLQGKLALSKHIDSNPINISNLRNGIYVIKFVNSENTLIYKFIKE